MFYPDSSYFTTFIERARSLESFANEFSAKGA